MELFRGVSQDFLEYATKRLIGAAAQVVDKEKALATLLAKEFSDVGQSHFDRSVRLGCDILSIPGLAMRRDKVFDTSNDTLSVVIAVRQ